MNKKLSSPRTKKIPAKKIPAKSRGSAGDKHRQIEKPAPPPVTSLSELEQSLLPILLAIMTRTLPGVIAQSGGLNPADGRAVRRLIDKADELLIQQVRELGHISSTKRRRYWRCLLQAMIEDSAIIFPPAPQLPKP